MCKHLIPVHVENTYRTRFFPNFSYDYYVPCGKCVECLKRRQTDYSTRIYREARKGQKMYFVTLTYRPDALPIAKRLYLCDIDTGVLDCKSNYEIETDSQLLERVRFELSRIPSGTSARYFDIDVFKHGSDLYFARFTPSLNRLDVRLWLKKSRIQYKRDFGKALPDFTYAFCGEYGAKGSRPHYHMLVFGLEKAELDYLTSRWEFAFGYTLSKEVPIVNPDGTDARMIVSRYVGKYISKGKFDLDSVRAGDCEKGRLCNSIRLGSRFTDEEVSYYRAYDLYGDYDIETMRLSSGDELTSVQMHNIALEVLKRNNVQVGDLVCPMPRALKLHLWYYPIVLTDYKNEFHEEVKKFYKRSPILGEIETILRNKFADKGERLFRKIFSDIDTSTICPETFVEFFQICRSAETNTDEIKQEFVLSTAYYRSQKDFQ